MTLAISVYVPSGIVLAADSRMTGTRREEVEEGDGKIVKETQIVLSDQAQKVIDLHKLPVGIATYGDAILEHQHIDNHVRVFEETALEGNETVEATAQKLLGHFHSTFPAAKIGFFLAGYEVENGRSVPYVFTVSTRRNSFERINLGKGKELEYGVLRGGDTLIVNRLVTKQFLPAFATMPLQDAIEYAIHLIRTTIEELRFEPRFPTVGGDIDVLAVLPRELTWVRKKKLHSPSI